MRERWDSLLSTEVLEYTYSFIFSIDIDLLDVQLFEWWWRYIIAALSTLGYFPPVSALLHEGPPEYWNKSSPFHWESSVVLFNQWIMLSIANFYWCLYFGFQVILWPYLGPVQYRFWLSQATLSKIILILIFNKQTQFNHLSTWTIDRFSTTARSKIFEIIFRFHVPVVRFFSSWKDNFESFILKVHRELG